MVARPPRLEKVSPTEINVLFESDERVRLLDDDLGKEALKELTRHCYDDYVVVDSKIETVRKSTGEVVDFPDPDDPVIYRRRFRCIFYPYIYGGRLFLPKGV